MFRSHYVGRTFIEPIAKNRAQAVRQKLHPRRNQFLGKRTIACDDSIVRSNTAKNVCKLVKEMGAQEISFFSASPHYIYPDIYGTDTYRVNEKLIMRKLGGNESMLADTLGIKQVSFLDLTNCINAILKAQEKMGQDHFKMDSFYTGPFTGEYPDGTGLCRIE